MGAITRWRAIRDDDQVAAGLELAGGVFKEERPVPAVGLVDVVRGRVGRCESFLANTPGEVGSDGEEVLIGADIGYGDADVRRAGETGKALFEHPNHLYQHTWRW